jgi:hypothetical protein
MCDECRRLHPEGERCACQRSYRPSDVVYHALRIWPFLAARIGSVPLLVLVLAVALLVALDVWLLAFPPE